MKYAKIIAAVLTILLICVSCAASVDDEQPDSVRTEQTAMQQQKPEEKEEVKESKEQEEKKLTIEPEIKKQEKLITLDLNKRLYDTDISEMCIGAAKNVTYQSLKINEDTITIVFTQEQHKEFCQIFAEMIDKLVNDLAENTDYIRLVNIKSNANYTSFYVYLSADSVNAEEQSIATVLNVYGVFYNIIANSDYDLITTNFIKYETNKVIESCSLSKMDALENTQYDTEQPETIVFEAEFTDGNYICGIHFPAGKYDVTAVDGNGHVRSSDFWDGGISASMGVDNDDTYISEFKNAKFEEDTILQVEYGLKIKIRSEKANATPLKVLNQTGLETITLGSGNYVAGEDFPTGVYDVIATAGRGNVSSDNSYADGGINAMMSGDVEKSNTYTSEYKNVILSDGVELTISGVTIDLIPSK